MNTTITMDEIHNRTQEKPGTQLAYVREAKGYSQEYVAGKLHLRVKIIELLEANNFDQMPEPVFIKGYIRAYAKLLAVPAEPLLEVFNSMYSSERKLEKALWQGKRESNKSERAVRLLTGLITISALIAAGFWWQKNKESQRLPTKNAHAEAKTIPFKTDTELKLTDLSKMQSVITSTSHNENQVPPMESHDG
ncbi:helix-turn-helix domain-containing protein [Legionella fairfieldensis]|uniref:helix-turn-helix domain-containing protein n=1 Tax=Legionella fairfieldensis TaxID=45064 RepID=UPI000491866C|nr:helix-turn-helix domain-containing protein [Legionella fairfieldensis]